MKTEAEVKKEIRELKKLIKEQELLGKTLPMTPRLKKASRDCIMSWQAQIDILKWVLKPSKTALIIAGTAANVLTKKTIINFIGKKIHEQTGKHKSKN